ncbi:MAG: hypothetical protein AAB403_01835 [Planctomycetota bacterium]
MTDPPRRWKPYCELVQVEADRQRAIEEIFAGEFAFIDDCLALAAKQVETLGDYHPLSVEDVAMRDLSCDAFEFLYEARRAVAENRPSVVFPAMRRAFESISLCHLFMVKPEFARKWSKGGTISNADVRKHLEHDPMTESVEQIREEYKHFSRGAHPNRTHVAYVFLGEGNRFTLGAIPPIDPFTLGDHVRHLIQLCYWYIGVFCYYYRESLPGRTGSKFATEFLKLTPRLKELRSALDGQLAEIQEKRIGQAKPGGIGPAFLDDEA